MLKLIFPNLLRIGRNNNRALDGPITMPKNPGELMDKIVGAYESFFKVWNTSLIPKMMKASKWSAGKSEPLLVGDIVYFKKVENNISSSWTVGKVVSIEIGRDGIPRRAEVEYHNPGASFGKKQVTDRAVRSLVKLFNIEDSTWKDDMAEVEKVIKALKEDKTDAHVNKSTLESAKKRLRSNLTLGSKIGLCTCSRNLKETIRRKCKFHFEDSYVEPKQTDFTDILDRSWDIAEEQIQEMSEDNYAFPGLMGILAVTNKFLDFK